MLTATRSLENILKDLKFGLFVNLLNFRPYGTNFTSMCFLIFSIVFPKTALFINLKKVFFEIVCGFLTLFGVKIYIGLEPSALCERNDAMYFGYNHVESQEEFQISIV